MTEALPNCSKCSNYFITHDPGKPYGCKALGFKSKTSPARVVYESSGMHCQLFSAKKKLGSDSGAACTS